MANTVTLKTNTLRVMNDDVDIDCDVDGTIIHIHVWKSHLQNTTKFPGTAAQKKAAWREYIADEAIAAYLKLNPTAPAIDLDGPVIIK